MSSRLFAALTAAGDLRFANEVARGAACGCVCPVCRSPLVAKQGDQREWHFAHEARQERPECRVGAANMLRHLAVEHLMQTEPLTLPAAEHTVVERDGRRALEHTIVWRPAAVVGRTWHESPAADAPVGLLSLSDTNSVHVYVSVDAEKPPAPQHLAGATGAITFHCPWPSAEALQTRRTAIEAIAAAGQLLWLDAPFDQQTIDTARKGLRTSLQKHHDADVAEMARRRALSSPPAVPPPPPPLPPVAAHYVWAPGHKPGEIFVAYFLHDGSSWVVYMRQDGRQAIAQFPERSDGWDEMLPPSVGVPDAQEGVYFVSALPVTMVWLAARAKAIRSDANPAAFQRFV